jgi:hypothetical protein
MRIENLGMTVTLVILGIIFGGASVYIWGSNPNFAETEKIALSVLISADARQSSALRDVLEHLQDRTPEQSNRVVCLLMQLNIEGMKTLRNQLRISSDNSDALQNLSVQISSAEHVFQVNKCNVRQLGSSATTDASIK